MNKRLLIAGSIFGFLGVLIGAFGAHGLKILLSSDELNTFETGVRYQIYHALLLLLVGIVELSTKTKKIILLLLTAGILLFSGSIYGLATNALTGFNFKQIAIVTPIGGTLLIAAWVVLIVSFMKMRSEKT